VSAMVTNMNLCALMGWCSEEDRAIRGSGAADAFLAVSGLLGLALDGFGVHVNRGVVRGGDGGWLRQRAAAVCDSVMGELGERKIW